jgi:hypothetical protein
MEHQKVKTNFIFPEDLLTAIDRLVGARKRTKFIVEATQEKLERLRFSAALERAAGAWKDENHPDLKTQGDINQYLREIREPTNKRLTRIIHKG